MMAQLEMVGGAPKNLEHTAERVGGAAGNQIQTKSTMEVEGAAGWGGNLEGESVVNMETDLNKRVARLKIT